ncbi:hypothetical protein F7725_024849 [Dissostichus mawsoni]|uniref:Uncharacterized protein n=1 Tax=Dissostichus mawsoni TaxID=36200 RepID=A0A7J5X9G0_DISMA|nr:hypothetical protein F7725_024849 [Dissostichus mawsoni]
MQQLDKCKARSGNKSQSQMSFRRSCTGLSSQVGGQEVLMLDLSFREFFSSRTIITLQQGGEPEPHSRVISLAMV